MTEITRKTSMKECSAIIDDPNSSEELVRQAKQRKSEILEWVKKQPPRESSSPQGREPARSKINTSCFEGLAEVQLKAIKKDTEDLLKSQLARIFYIEQFLEAKGIFPNGPFVGMLYNNQILMKT